MIDPLLIVWGRRRVCTVFPEAIGLLQTIPERTFRRPLAAMLRIVGEFARRWGLLSALVHNDHILAVRDGGKMDQVVANVLTLPRIVGDRRLRWRVDQVVRPVRFGDHAFE